jgi:hypothetical protein
MCVLLLSHADRRAHLCSRLGGPGRSAGRGGVFYLVQSRLPLFFFRLPLRLPISLRAPLFFSFCVPRTSRTAYFPRFNSTSSSYTAKAEGRRFVICDRFPPSYQLLLGQTFTQRIGGCKCAMECAMANTCPSDCTHRAYSVSVLLQDHHQRLVDGIPISPGLFAPGTPPITSYRHRPHRRLTCSRRILSFRRFVWSARR